MHELAKQFIGGHWRDGTAGKALVNTNPFSGEVLAKYPAASLEGLDAAYPAADTARAEWRGMNAYARRTVFEKAVRFVQENHDDIVPDFGHDSGPSGPGPL